VLYHCICNLCDVALSSPFSSMHDVHITNPTSSCGQTSRRKRERHVGAAPGRQRANKRLDLDIDRSIGLSETIYRAIWPYTTTPTIACNRDVRASRIGHYTTAPLENRGADRFFGCTLAISLLLALAELKLTTKSKRHI
jgi:hypothetical protein